MARTHWTPKNRYCRDSNLTEEEFTAIVACFVKGRTATSAQKAMSEDGGYKVSRPTVATYFVRIGNYIYEKMARPAMLEAMRGENPGLDWPDEKLERYAVEELWKNMRGETDYEAYRERGLIFPHEVFRTLLVHRNKKLRGLTRDTFPSHLGYLFYRYYVDAVAQDPSVRWESIPQEQRVDRDAIEMGGLLGLIERLARDPL